eukprot:40272-Pelagomonas_calceolata.AAC.1
MVPSGRRVGWCPRCEGKGKGREGRACTDSSPDESGIIEATERSYAFLCAFFTTAGSTNVALLCVSGMSAPCRSVHTCDVEE